MQQPSNRSTQRPAATAKRRGAPGAGASETGGEPPAGMKPDVVSPPCAAVPPQVGMSAQAANGEHLVTEGNQAVGTLESATSSLRHSGDGPDCERGGHLGSLGHCDGAGVGVSASSSKTEGGRGVHSWTGQPAAHEQLLGLLNDGPTWCPITRNALRMALHQCLSDIPGSDDLWRQAWAANRDALMYGIQDLCLQDPRSVDSALEALRAVVDVGDALHLCDSSTFKLDFALAAHRKGALSLSVWMSDAVAKEGGEDLARECMVLAAERYEGQEDTRSGRIESDVLLPLAKSLEGIQHKSSECRAASERLRGASRPRLLGGVGPAGGPPPAPGDAGKVGVGAPGAGATGPAQGAPVGDAQQQGQQQSALFAPDIEEEANSHFQRIYTNKLQIEGVIQMLKGFKTSTNQREQEVFACMIHNLFDEYRFFPRYPERELLITGRLFGSLIQHHLVSSITLGIALRYVLEALRKPLRSNMFKFGMCALEQFKQRLVEWPQYCHHILQITHVRQAHEDLINYIQEALSSSRPAGVAPDGSQQAPLAQQGAPLAPPMVGGVPGIAAASGAAPLQQQPAKAPGAGAVQPAPGRMQQQPVPGAKPGVATQPLAGGAGVARPAGYGAFEAQGGGQEMNSFSGFSQGFGQQGSSQLPTNLQNVASDSGAGGSEERAATVEMSAAVQQTLSVVSGASAFGATTNIDMLVQQAKEVTTPDNQLQDKIHFIFNNLSNTNLEQKEKELTSALSPHGELYTPWLGQYIVIKRAAQEQNYHSLYLSLVDRLDRHMKSLLKDVVMTTIENIKILLDDAKIKGSSSLRSLLKNLGSWLGLLTLQRNRPILQMRLDFKHLLVDAFEKGKLVAVVPFVAKVLDSTMNSRIFRPPNPWTMMVLGILAELHPMTDLKLNIKFEVEVLCKNLNQELKDVKVSTVFKDRPVNKEGNSDWTSKMNSTNLGALKALPQVPDERLMAAAAGLVGGSLGGGTSSLSGMAGDDKGSGLMPGLQGPGGQSQQQQAQQQAQANQDLTNINVSQFVIINPSITILQQHPHLVQLVAAGINQAIKDIIAPVVERSVTIALITSRELILKDFVFEKDDVIKGAGRMMVQNLAGSLALVTCKEPLRHNMVNQLRGIIQKYFAAAFANEVMDSNALEPAVQMIAQDNLDLGCNLIEKAAVDRAGREMDVQLDIALAQRRQPGNQMYEMFKEQQRFLRVVPDALSPKREGGLLPHQRRVYEDFARLLRERPSMQAVASGQGQAMAGPGMDKALRAFNEAPGHMAQNLGPQGQVPQAMPQRVDPINQAQMQAIRQALDKCVLSLTKAEEFVMGNFNVLAGSSFSALPQGHDLAQVIMQARSIVLQVQGPNREELAVAFAQKLFVRLYDKTKFGRCRLGVDWIMAVLSHLNEISKRVSKEITNWMAVDAERKLNIELTIALVSNRLMSIGSPDYVREMITAMDMGRNQATIDATVSILQVCLVDKRFVSTNECAALLDALTTIAQASSRKQGDSLMRLLDGTRNLARAPPAAQQQAQAAAAAVDRSKLMQQRNMMPVGKGKDADEPPGARGEMGFILDKWVAQVQSNNDRGAVQFILQLLQRGFLKGDETTDRFLRLSVELAVERCLVSLEDQSQVTAKVQYLQVDALAQLVAVLLRYFDEWKQTTNMSKVTLFNKMLAVVVKQMHVDHAERKTNFNQKPFHRLLLRLLLDTSDVLGEQTQMAFADALLALQPRLVPGFAFAWLELASHKAFMPRLLQDKDKGSVLFSRIMLGLFKYMWDFLLKAELQEPIKTLYMGTLRVLLVLLHDFPEFLCEYHFALCDAIPPSCIQLRNLILSAFPKEMVLPDPFTFQERLPPMDANKTPIIVSNYTAALTAANLRGDLDAFLQGRGSRTLLQDLQGHLLHRNSADAAAAGTRYNISLMNALVLYTAEFAISHGAGDKVPIERGSSMEIFVKLSRDLDNEGRYYLLTGMANQLRYPNHHTQYLSCVLLWLFKCASDKEIVREQLTRVLIERLIVNKPHPWGLLNTFYELIRNPAYEFWRHDFVRSNVQISDLLQNIARYCGNAKPGESSAEGGQQAQAQQQPPQPR